MLLTWLQVLHSISAHQLELLNSMEGYVESEVLSKLKPVEKCWQPADFLPEGNDPDYVDKVRLLPMPGGWCQLLGSWLQLRSRFMRLLHKLGIWRPGTCLPDWVCLTLPCGRVEHLPCVQSIADSRTLARLCRRPESVPDCCCSNCLVVLPCVHSARPAPAPAWLASDWQGTFSFVWSQSAHSSATEH